MGIAGGSDRRQDRGAADPAREPVPARLTAEEYRRLSDLFEEARGLPEAEQEALLERLSTESPRLSDEVRSLLRHHREAERFLDRAPLPPDLQPPSGVEELEELEDAKDAKDSGEAGASREADEPDAVLPEQVGPYRVLQVLGEGGMGTVYLAEQRTPILRRVALKVIKLGMDTREVVARFEAERQALALMDHPCIARIHDAGATEDGRPYFAMEYVPGEPITRYADRNRLSMRERLELFIRVCDAVQHAHQKAIIHRDIKPTNVLVKLQDGSPLPKIIDFGVAKATDRRLTEKTLFTEVGQIIGTPEYMSPEQAEVGLLDVDTRTDVYSLGVLLYELVTGVLPFSWEELGRAAYHEIQRIIREVEPPRPSTRVSRRGPDTARIAANRGTDPVSLRRQLRGDLDWITMRAMEKDRRRRYASASELAQDIARHLGDEPVLAGPPSAAYLMRKFAARHRRAVAALTGIFLVMAAALAVSLWLYGQAREAKEEALEYAGELSTASVALQEERDAAVKAREDAIEQRNTAYHNSYVAQMRLAYDDWEEGQVQRLRQTLRRHLPQPGRPDRRGWEWYYLLALSESATATLRGHRDAVRAVAWNPDGRRVASAGNDGTIRVWDRGSGEDLVRMQGTRSGGCDLDWSPDGRRIASTIGCEGVAIWEADSGRRVLDLGSETALTYALDWCPRGDLIATCAQKGDIAVWDATSGAKRASMAEVEGYSSTTIEWCLEGDRLAVARNGLPPYVSLLEYSPGESLKELAVFPGDTTDIFGISLSPDSGRLAIANYHFPAIQIFDILSGTEHRRLRHNSGVNCVAFSPDGRFVASGTRGQRVNVWNVETAENVLGLQGHEGWVHAVSWSPDGKWLATGSRDRTIRIWRMEGLLDRPGTAESLEGWHLSWSPDGRYLASAGWSEISLWDPECGRTLWTVPGHRAVTWSPDGKKLITCDIGGKARIRDAETGQEIAGIASRFERLAWTGNGEYRLEWSPDGKKIASFLEDRTTIWDASTGEVLVSLQEEPLRHWTLSFSPDSRRLATGSWSGPIVIWDVETGRRLATLLGHDKWVCPIKWSPDGKRIVSGGWDQTVRGWDPESGLELFSLDAHTGVIADASWSPDGRRFVTIGGGAVKVWDAESAEELLSLRGLGMVAWSPDGRRIAHRDEETRIVIRDASPGYALAPLLQAQERARDWASEGLRLAREGEAPASDEAFARAREADPGYAIPYRDRAAMYAGAGEIDLAIVDYREMVALDPEDPSSRSALARLMVARAGSTTRDGIVAIAHVEKLLEGCGRRGEHSVTLAMAHYRAGHHDEARSILDRVLEDRSCCPRLAGIYLSMVTWQLGDKDAARAIYERALGEGSPEDAAAPEMRLAESEAAALLGDRTRGGGQG